MKKRILIVSLVAVLVIAAVCILPWPEKVHVELKGWAVDEAGNATEGASVCLEGWQLHYLLRQDQLHVDISVVDGAEAASFSAEVPVLKIPEGKQYAAGLYYDGEVNGYLTFQLGFDEAWSRCVLMTQETATVFAADNGQTPEALQSFFDYAVK